MRGISEVSNSGTGKTVLGITWSRIEEMAPECPANAWTRLPKKMGSERPKVDTLYVDVRVQLCEVVDALVVVVLCWDMPVLDVPLIAATALPRT